ncbi:MAG: ATP-binding protein [Chloroflexi bacterium]|nr:ATP-binding protein [Chloroflexota bacterium]
MSNLVHETLYRLTDVIAAKGARIKIEDMDGWPLALGYAPWVEEIWVNYLSNALKYGGQSPTIILSATRQTEGFVRFEVRDNGPGLTAVQQARLFTPFERLDRQNAAGHGLGLSIVHRIVEKLGGQAGVESELGQGSLFYFTLPESKTEM